MAGLVNFFFCALSSPGKAVNFSFLKRMGTGIKTNKISVYFCAAQPIKELESFIASLPEQIGANALSEVLLFGDENPISASKLSRVRILHAPHHSTYGNKQKIAFDDALERGQDGVLVVYENVKRLTIRHIEQMLQDFSPKKTHLVAGHFPVKGDLINTMATRLVTSVLNVPLSELSHAVRVFSGVALNGIPYGCNGEGTNFDSELLIQCRAWGSGIEEVCLETALTVKTPLGILLKQRVGLFLQGIKYRLHQLHLIRDPRFLLKFPHLYTLKESPYSSHSIIVRLVKENSVTLDVGCGPGLLASLLKKKNNRVTGLDVSDSTTPDTMEEYYRVDLEKDEVWNVRRAYDFVLLADVLEHIRNPEQVLRNSTKVLASHGRLIASTGNIAIWFYRLSLLMGRFNYGERGVLDRGHVHLYTIANFEKLLLKNGFRIIKKHYTNIPFEFLFESTGRSAIIKFIDWTYSRFVLLMPTLFAYQIIIEAEPRGSEVPVSATTPLHLQLQPT